MFHSKRSKLLQITHSASVVREMCIESGMVRCMKRKDSDSIEKYVIPGVKGAIYISRVSVRVARTNPMFYYSVMGILGEPKERELGSQDTAYHWTIN